MSCFYFGLVRFKILFWHFMFDSIFILVLLSISISNLIIHNMFFYLQLNSCIPQHLEIVFHEIVKSSGCLLVRLVKMDSMTNMVRLVKLMLWIYNTDLNFFFFYRVCYFDDIGKWLDVCCPFDLVLSLSIIHVYAFSYLLLPWLWYVWCSWPL